jgi:hypothetical protein
VRLKVGPVSYELYVLGMRPETFRLSKWAVSHSAGWSWFATLDSVVSDYASDRQCTLTQARLVIEALAFESVAE